EARTEHGVPMHDSLPRGDESSDVQSRAEKKIGEADVVEWARRLELVHVELGQLIRRERVSWTWADTLQAYRRRGYAGALRAVFDRLRGGVSLPRLVDGGSHALDGLPFEDRSKSDLDSEAFADPCDGLQGKKRVPAQIEEPIAPANLGTEELGPQMCDHL